MPSFSFVHTADLHLDSPFLGLGKLPESEERVVRTLREATFEAFDAVIELCRQQEVDFLLVAGDVYDGADRSLRAQLRFRDGLARLAEQGIRAYVVHGNHDPLDGWSHALQMPATVHVFGEQPDSVVFEKQGVPVARIHGISYPSRATERDFGRAERCGEEPFQIGLLHCNAGGDPRHDPYAPRSVRELEDSRLDYWALGHIHERTTLRPADPFIGYPGNTQGRHIHESGPRGCLLVQVGSDGRLVEPPAFVPTDQVRWSPCRVDIRGHQTVTELRDELEDRLDELLQQTEGRPLVTRVTLEGRGPLHRELARENAREDLEETLRARGLERAPFVWIERLVLQTRPEIDWESRRAGQDFLGDLLRLMEGIRQEPEAIRELETALRDLYQHRRARRFLDPPDEAWLESLLDEAEIRCADLLAEEED